MDYSNPKNKILLGKLLVAGESWINEGNQYLLESFLRYRWVSLKEKQVFRIGKKVCPAVPI